MASERTASRSTNGQEQTGDEGGHGFVADLPMNACQVADAAGAAAGEVANPLPAAAATTQRRSTRRRARWKRPHGRARRWDVTVGRRGARAAAGRVAATAGGPRPHPRGGDGRDVDRAAQPGAVVAGVVVGASDLHPAATRTGAASDLPVSPIREPNVAPTNWGSGSQLHHRAPLPRWQRCICNAPPGRCDWPGRSQARSSASIEVDSQGRPRPLARTTRWKRL